MKNILKKMTVYIAGAAVSICLIGGLTGFLLGGFTPEGFSPESGMERLFSGTTLLYGTVETILMALLYHIFHIGGIGRRTKNVLKDSYRKSGAQRIEGALENARFMEDEERDENFPRKLFSRLEKEKQDGIPLYAVYNQKRRELELNLMKPAHGIIIGATGSGKTTTFINPTIQILGHTRAGSSMICTDPKGELFQLHSAMLKERGYQCMVLDLRDPYSSFRWNPLGDIYDRYQEYFHTGDEIYERTDSIEHAGGLELCNEPESYEECWYEYKGRAYSDRRQLIQEIHSERQRIYDGVYEDLNDLVSVICPIESQNDPVWERGARSIILATLLAMLEDSETPELEMTKDKFCFYNLNKAISNSEDEFAALKDFFKGREKTSKAVGLSRQVLSAAEQTLSSYMSIAFDKLSMFNDEGICAMTSATDIQPERFAEEPTALFLKIPDEKDTRHVLAGVFILSIYKALIKVASAREDLSLPRNVYFLLDEFGNMPQIEKFDKMITVGRSRKIWFQMVVQSFAQLDNVYGPTVANIIKGNCGLKMFIGSNDIGTCDEFSKLCGNMTVETRSVSSSTVDRTGAMNVSSSLQTRPLIYPSELMKLNNQKNSGNAIVVTFGNPPLRTKFTPSYKCPLYQTGQMSEEKVRNNYFYGAEVLYNLDERNYLVLEQKDLGEAEETEEALHPNGEERGAAEDQSAEGKDMEKVESRDEQ